MALPKLLTIGTMAAALSFAISGARAESYGNDAPNAGVSETAAKPKPGKVRIVTQQLVVHPGVTSKKRGK